MVNVISVVLGIVSILQNISIKKTLEERKLELIKALDLIDRFYEIVSYSKKHHDCFTAVPTTAIHR